MFCVLLREEAARRSWWTRLSETSRLTISFSFSFSLIAYIHSDLLAPLIALVPFVLSSSVKLQQKRVWIGPVREELRVWVACGAGQTFFTRISSVSIIKENELIGSHPIYRRFIIYSPISSHQLSHPISSEGRQPRERQPWRTICRPNMMWSL